MKNTIKYTSKKLLCFAIVLCFLCSCKSNKIDKTETDAEDLVTLQNLFEQTEYYIEIDVAYPFNTVATAQVTNMLLRNTGDSAGRIDVRGDGNFIEINSDSISGYMPFFGERRNNSGEYGGRNIAIEFEEPYKDLDKGITEDKSKLDIEFSAHQKGSDNERYNIRLEIYPNKNVSVSVNSTYKTFMRYDGRLVDKNSED